MPRQFSFMVVELRMYPPCAEPIATVNVEQQ
jgi:hypothetical protein